MLKTPLKPGGGGAPTGAIADAINKDFGSYDKFKEEFSTAGATQFGSGWAWLVLDPHGKLVVVSTSNAHNPLEMPGTKSLLACDVWEHAYYLDTQNNRASYLEHFWQVCNWESVHQKLRDASQ